MKKMMTVFAFFGAVILAGTQAQAADGSSGCGPGWYLFKENSLLSSALRGTTNGALFPVVTIGMTIGTSNCTQHKLVLKEKESLHFATMNHYELKNAMVQGRGEYLSAFGETMGCPASVQGKLNQSLRGNFNAIYPNRDVKPDAVLIEVYKTILSDRELTQACSLASLS
ncbi:MAG: DUF3015 family protein [Bdellovibrionaceae bacterium]|nr:DUF3015 family protein [Pseudobdellovibrionaceae bacterium]